MLVNIIHGFASSIETSFVQKPGNLQEPLAGVPERIRLAYNKEKIAALASVAIKEADRDNDNRISWPDWQQWYPKGIDAALGSMAAIFNMAS